MRPTAQSAVGSRPAMTTTATTEAPGSAAAAASTANTTTPTTATTTTTTTIMTQFTPKHRVPKPKRKRKGWGPYQSIVKERSVDFNLTLDIQNLRQEIQQLLTTRELLQSRSLQLRHSPTGSLMQTVHKYVRLFRQGFPVQELPSQRVVDTSGERNDFLYSVIDPEIDFGNGNRGVEFMVEQIRRYSLLTRFIAMDMATFEIVLLDDDVVLIKASGSWRFQVLRETILGMFPHVAGNEWLLSRLVGHEVCVPTTILFRFTRHDRICQYEPDANFVASFSDLLTDPDDLAELLGRARIGEHSTIGVTKDGRLEDVEAYMERTPRRGPNIRLIRMYEEEEEGPGPEYAAPASSLDFYIGVAQRYVDVFARERPGLSEASYHNAWETALPEFLRRFVATSVICGHSSGHKAVEHKWRALRESFQVMDVYAAAPPEAWRHRSAVFARVQLVYRLRIDGHTIHSVFPHTRQFPSLVSALVGATIACPSVLELEWADADDADDAAVVTCIREHFDWHEALSPLLPREADREFVCRYAALCPQGHVLQQPAASQRLQRPNQVVHLAYRPQADARDVWP